MLLILQNISSVFFRLTRTTLFIIVLLRPSSTYFFIIVKTVFLKKPNVFVI